jgi:N-acetylneuraminic acid mutarotase
MAIVCVWFSVDRVHAAPWHLVAQMPEPRWFHSAGVGSDGRIYAYAGYVRSSTGREYGIGDRALDVYEPKTDTWKRGPAISAVEIKGLVRHVRGWFDENGKKHEEIELQERTSELRLSHEGPVGRSDALGRPRWSGQSYWVPFDPERNAWGEVEKAISLPSTDIGKPRTSTWKDTGPAYFRYSPTLATSPDGTIYITGGAARPYRDKLSVSRVHESVEAWDARTNRWREIAPMHHARDQHAAAVDRKGRLFVFGGTSVSVGLKRGQDESTTDWDMRGAEFDRQANTSLGSVEMYDPATNTWTERAPLPTPRQAMGADVGADGRIYVVGGAPSYMHPKPMDVVEIYDPEKDTWEKGPPLVYPRRSHAVVATPDGKIYAIGGFVAPRERGVREQLLGAKVDPGLGATVEVLDTRTATRN